MKLLPRKIFQTRSHAFTYRQLGIFMLFPLWPLLVSYVRKKHQIYRGCSGVFRDDEPKICQGSCFLSTRKNTVSHGKKEQHDAGVNYSKLEETPDIVSPTHLPTHNSQLRVLEMIRTICSKHHFSQLKNRKKTPTKQG